MIKGLTIYLQMMLTDLVPRYLPVFANQNAWVRWRCSLQYNSQSRDKGLLLVTETNSNRNARALVQKIGPSSAICVSASLTLQQTADSDEAVKPTCETEEELGTAVKIAVVAPVSNFVESLTVGHLSAGKINEDYQILINRVAESMPPVEPGSTMTIVENLTVSEQATIDTLVVENLITSSSAQQTLGGSSKRFKDNIQLLDTEFDHILTLQPVSFVYKPFQTYAKPTGGNRQIGLIAEDVQKVFPELVIYQEDQPVNVDYEKLSVVVLKLVQELQQDVKIFQAENQQLQEQLKDTRGKTLVITSDYFYWLSTLLAPNNTIANLMNLISVIITLCIALTSGLYYLKHNQDEPRAVQYRAVMASEQVATKLGGDLRFLSMDSIANGSLRITQQCQKHPLYPQNLYIPANIKWRIEVLGLDCDIAKLSLSVESDEFSLLARAAVESGATLGEIDSTMGKIHWVHRLHKRHAASDTGLKSALQTNSSDLCLRCISESSAIKIQQGDGQTAIVGHTLAQNYYGKSIC